MTPIPCEICGGSLLVEDYGDGDCPDCGARYCYDEKHSLCLGPVVRLDQEKGEVTFKYLPGP